VQIQIEVTTACQCSCFYCAGRRMPQRHMQASTFEAILARLPPGTHRVSLQGEGEPTLHPRFWEMTGRVSALGHEACTITNGLRLEPEQAASHLRRIGVSIDTLEEDIAARIGRTNVERVAGCIQGLVALMGARRVILYSVDVGQDLGGVRRFAAKLGTKHIVQPLQRKADYARWYRPGGGRAAASCTYSCRFLNSDVLRYYDVSGTEMPCCFIKDTTTYTSTQNIRECLARHIVPPSCDGCGAIYPG
jgi:MoaA/NifB/PqqE/SkfB family radical SAM enzyme